MFATFTVLYILPDISLRCHTEQLTGSEISHSPNEKCRNRIKMNRSLNGKAIMSMCTT